MVEIDFVAANHVRIVGLCGQAHRAVIFAIAQLSCFFQAFNKSISLGRAVNCGGNEQ